MFDIVIYRSELRDHLGLDTADLDAAGCDLLINRSYAWLLNAFNFRTKEISVKFNATAGERNYDLPDDFESLRGISVEDLIDGQHTPLDRMTSDYYESVYKESTGDEWAKPTHYLREDGCIKLWPTPDDAYVHVLKYDKLLSDLSDSNLTPELPKNWEEFILLGAVYRGHLKFGDMIRADAIKKSLYSDVQAAKPVEKKEEIDSHRAALQAEIPSYDV